MNRYPYPVLSPEESSYNEDVNFSITYLRNSYNTESLILDFKIDLNSVTLKTLLANKQARLIICGESNLFSLRKNIEGEGETYQFFFPLEKLQRNDSLKVLCYVVANEGTVLARTDEMCSFYRDGYSVSLRKNDILAKSNTETLYFNSGNCDFIKFEVKEDQKGYSIVFGENYIRVMISPAFNAAYSYVKRNNSDYCAMFDSHLVFEIFVFILIRLVFYYDENKETEWYKLFEKVFLTSCNNYNAFEDFIRAVKDQDGLEVDIIYKEAHKMINNQIENMIVLAGVREA